MDDNPPKENPPPGFNKIDLSQLQGFSFGTQWTQDKGGAQDKRDRTDVPQRRDDRRDRRAFRRPDGGPDAPRDDTRGSGPGTEAGAPQRREYSGDRRERPDMRGGPRAGGERGGYGPGRGAMHDRAPYDSPYYSVTFYPEDTSFNALVKTIRASCRTIELFEIARTVLGKPERFTVLLAPKDPSAPAVPGRQGQPPRTAPRPAGPPAGDSAPTPVAPAPDEAAAAAPPQGEPAAAGAVATAPETQPAPEPPPRPAFHISAPDGLPFESADAAIAHVLSHHLKLYFDMQEVEVDPPKGSFQVVNRCGVTGELLGPPNYHRYNQIVQQHYASKGLRMPFEAFRSRIETVREPELINQWLEKMKRVTRYTWKNPPHARRPGAPAAPAVAAETEAPRQAESEAAAPAAADAPAAPPQDPPPPAFDSLDEARMYLLTHARDRVVRTAAHARFHGREADALPQGEVRRAIEGTLERQRRFPLDTANALRGRLRREHFTIFKKGAKGISYVCAVKRKFRVPGQTFAESIGNLIAYIEAHPMVRAGELVKKYLGVQEASADPAVKVADGAAASASLGAAAPARPESEPVLSNVLSVEQREKIGRMQGDLLWLVREGYVTEFIDGSLYAPPPMVEARKKEVESEEHDPENFPDPTPESPSAEEASPAEEIPSAPDAPSVPEADQAPAVPAAEELQAAPEPANLPAEGIPPEAAPPSKVEAAPLSGVEAALAPAEPDAAAPPSGVEAAAAEPPLQNAPGEPPAGPITST